MSSYDEIKKRLHPQTEDFRVFHSLLMEQMVWYFYYKQYAYDYFREVDMFEDEGDYVFILCDGYDSGSTISRYRFENPNSPFHALWEEYLVKQYDGRQ